MLKLSVAFIAVAVLALAMASPTQDKTPESLLAEITGLVYPGFDSARTNDPEYFAEFRKSIIEVQKRESELIWEFYELFPDHDMTHRLLERRWFNIFESGVGEEETLADIDKFLESEEREALVDQAQLTRAYVRMMASMDPKQMLAIANEFATAFPDNPNGARLYAMAASYADAEDVDAVTAILMEKYPDSMEAAFALGKKRQVEALGKPFEFSFTDAVTGNEVTNKDFEGKILVIDFWATWCGPCIADLPKLKEIYAKYEGQIEIIGISLDGPGEAGLAALKKFVEENDMAWPQFYQDGWEGEFTKGWGINAIPTVFLVDKSGNLVDVEARMDLESKIEALLNGD